MVSQAAVSHEPHPEPRPLGPDSLTWKIFGSLYYGPTGFFMGMVQNMHPGLGAGVEFHSDIGSEPYQRVLRSSYPILGVVFDGPRARQTAQEIVGYHREIKGVDAQGRRYHALDPGTFYWAHAVFFMQTLRTAEHFMGGLTGPQREQLWREHYQWYEMYGMSMRVVPQSWNDFRRYWRDMCRDTLEPTPAAWDVYNLIDTAPVPPFPVLRRLPEPLWEKAIRPAGAGLVKFITVGLCDPAIRDTMGFPWTDRDQWLFDRLCRAISALNRVTPDEVKYAAPRVRAARRRVAGKRPPDMPPPEAPESLWPAPEHRADPKHYCPVHADPGGGAATTFRQLTGF
ncbi:oxygenase MpaB family protein [Nocardia sp. NPDC006630]|uniref:oxygenase MpaB family protein n=1 Tax=Nocardia sp. NPDC006630 TaxID=3157181 RepID=UPI0033BEA5F4